MTTFTPNPRFVDEVVRERPMLVFLEAVADDAAREVDAGAPRIVKHSGSRIEGVVVSTPTGAAAEVRVWSPFWHWREFGTVRMAAQPYLRPGVLKALASRGGRLTEGR